jgi:hypothetical protein
MSKTMTASASLKPLAFRPRRWARLGAWGLAFFALKGVAWLIVPLLVAYLA